MVDSQETESRPCECIIYVDLLPARSDSAYVGFLSTLGPAVSALHIRPAGESLLDPASSMVLVGEASHLIRDWASKTGATEVHLLLRCPWGIALLLGRSLNTIRVRLYEWEDGPDDTGATVPARYLPTLIVRSGGGGSPIESVVLPAHPST